MRGSALALCLGAVLVICDGCGKDYLPRRLLVHDTTPGKLGLTMAGSAESLRRSQKIDLHRRIPVGEGVEIDVWVIKARPSEPAAGAAGVHSRATVVMLHGLGQSKAQFLDLGRRLAKRSYDVVLLDLRAHGASTGRYVTYGYWERADVKNVVDELVADRTVNPRVYVLGVSLGAATGIQYAAIDEGRRVRGVAAVAAFKDVYSVCRRRLPFWTSEENFQHTLQRAADKELGNFIPEQASALRAVAVLACPILLIHGRLDTEVPYEHSKALLEAAKEPKKLIPVEWAGHALFLGRERWFADRVDELDTVARNFEKQFVVQPATAPAPKEPPPEPPPVMPPAPKPPPMEIPTTKPAAPQPPATQPTTRPSIPKPPPPPPTEIPVEPFRRPKEPPATKPAAPKPPAEEPPVIRLGEPAPPPTTAPTTRPAEAAPPPKQAPTAEPTPPPPTTAPTTKPAAPKFRLPRIFP